MENSENKKALQLDAFSIKKAALVLRAINHKLRVSIIKMLDEEGKLTVTEIYIKLRLEQSVASQHLAILRTAGIVDTIRDGKNIHYSLNYKKIENLSIFVADLLKG